MNEKCSFETYLKEHSIKVYLADAIEQFTQLANSGVEARQFFHEYFASVQNGTNVLYRTYVYVKSTRENRISFLKNIFVKLRPLEDRVQTSADYSAIIQLICPDFDKEVIEKCFKNEKTLPLFAFMRRFQFQFVFQEFYQECEKLYVSIEDAKNEANTCANSNLFYHHIKRVLYDVTNDVISPPQNLVNACLTQRQELTISFHQFIERLIECEQLNSYLAVLSNH